MRDYEFHEVSNIFPLMQGEEFQQLVEDIRQHGLREPIWLYQDKIIDGRNRYRACQEAGVTIRYRVWGPYQCHICREFFNEKLWACSKCDHHWNEAHDGCENCFTARTGTDWFSSEKSLVSFVLSLNLHRRHLSESQRALVAAKVANLEQGFRTDLQPSVNSQKVSQPEAAELLNVSPWTVSKAKKVLDEGTPALVEKVQSGEVAVSFPTSLLATKQARMGPPLHASG